MKKARAVRYDEIEGKTVAGAGWGNDKMLVAFTDGTVLALRIEHGCGCGDDEIMFEQGRDIDLLSSQWASEAVEAGAITREEYKQSCKEQDAKRIARLESELKELKRAKVTEAAK